MTTRPSRTAMLAASVFCLAALVPGAAHGANQVRVTEIRSANSPLISFRVMLRAGSINDLKGKEGINALTALMIAQGGTAGMTYQEVVSTLYPWAASIQVQPDKEVTTFIGNVHRDHLEQFYGILSGLLLEPRFDPDDFTRNKDLMLSYLERNLRGTDDENLGKEALVMSMFPGHPYGTAGATVQGLKNTSIEDVRAYYRKTYTTGSVLVGIAGGYPQSLVERIRKDFGRLPDGAVAPVPLPEPAAAKDLEVTYIQKPARATAISIGHPIDVTRKDRDFYALMVANSYFGEHRTFNGVLMNSLRGNRGLNYGTYSYIERFIGGVNSGSRFPEVNTPLRDQYFSIWIRPVQPENAHFALRNAMVELDRLVKTGLTKEQFEQTRKFLVNYSKLWAQTLDRRLGHALDAEFYGSGDYIARIERELQSMTVEEVNAAIRKHISPRNLKASIVVQDAEALRAKIESNAPSPISYQAQPGAAVLEEDRTIEAFPLNVNREQSRILPVEKLFENESPGVSIRRTDKKELR